MSIRILEAGLLDTIQDHGRYGYAAWGINPGGAMDTIAASVANILAANNEHKAVIEMHFPASSFYFNKTTLIALSGADFSPSINDINIPLNTPVVVQAGAILQFKKLKAGARCYLAVNGGITTGKWLNSYSTNLRAQAGGCNGRSLQKDDSIQYDASFNFPSLYDTTHTVLPWHADITSFYSNEIIRIIKGHEFEYLTDCSETIIEGNTFIISTQSDRMGYRMNGSPLKLQAPMEMISSAVSKGTIQLLPSGQIIILMADHQATGGYPRLAHVAAADISTLAQLQPNKAIRFQLIGLKEAESLLLQQYHHLQQIKTACTFAWQQYLQQHGIDRS